MFHTGYQRFFMDTHNTLDIYDKQHYALPEMPIVRIFDNIKNNKFIL